MIASDFEYFADKIDNLIEEIPNFSVSQWAESKRYLPPELSPISGFWDNSVTPYHVEIMDCFSVSSPIREIAVMKGAQIGASTAVLENVIGYTIDHSPAPMMIVGSDQDSAETAGELRVDRMIESCGLADKIFSQGGGTSDRFKRKTGFTKRKKEFAGGFLRIASAGSPSSLASISVKILLMDEIDRYPLTVGKDGSPVSVAVKRCNAYKEKSKILYISTPLIKNTSEIYKAFLRGDQRYYYVPCKHCAHMQVIKFKNIKFKKGDDDILIDDSVYYECIKCKGKWLNHDKAWFLPRGEWRATGKPINKYFRSYHLSAFYSPVGMYSWESAVQDFLDSQQDINKLKAWTNTVAGEPWEERGDKIRYQRILSNRIEYTSGTVPKEVLFLTMAADVHKDRIDLEILGWANKCVTYSIKWTSIHGNTEKYNDGAWNVLKDIMVDDYFGHKIQMVMIDCGYLTDIVYDFCASTKSDKVIPIKGVSDIKYSGSFKTRKVDGYGEMIGINALVNYYKDRLNGWLHSSIKDDIIPWGYCYYPSDYTDDYFKQYSNEQKYEVRNSRGMVVGHEWRKINNNADNHAFDCRIYNIVAFDYLLNLTREYMEQPKLTIKDFLNYFEEQKRG